jgi:hypothetical protein
VPRVRKVLPVLRVRVLTVRKVLLVRVVRVPMVPVVLMVLAVLGACGDLNVKMGIYANLDEARRAGAFAHGWVPEGLPAAASDLREGHVPDGRHWGAFSFAAADAAPVRGLLGPEITTGTLKCEPPGRLEFWPRVLLSPVDVERVRSTGFRLYSGRDSRTYAVNWGQGRAYYWRS